MSELAEIRELRKLIDSGRLREYSGDPFPVDSGAAWAGFPPRREDCVRVESLILGLVRREVPGPPNPFGPSRSEFVEMSPPVAVVVQRAVEFAEQLVGLEWAVCFDVVVGADRFGTFYGNRWGWELDPA